MKKISQKGLDQDIFLKTLKNGLEVILIPYENKNNYFMTYATKFGSTITSFIPNNSKKMIKVPDGIAHFLEHKMFEQPSGEDPFTYYSQSGTGANASTSFDSTQYICYGTKNFKENLSYLIDYVNTPYFTDENVEKEKGIITEELKMYLDIPDFQIENELRKSIYKTNPRRIDIGGTVEEIEKITKEDLYLCYNNFYSPNNMFILIAGNFNVDEAINIIEEKLKDKPIIKLPKIKKVKEIDAVNKKEETIYSDIKIPKLGLGLKIPKKNINISSKVELDLYLSMLTSIIFGSSSEFREKLRSNKLINNLYTEWETTEDHKVLLLYASTENIEELIQEIKNELKNINMDEKAFERIKKVWIANEVKITDHIEATVGNLYDDIVRYNKVISNRTELIRKMKFSKLLDIISNIDMNNTSIVKMLPKDK